MENIILIKIFFKKLFKRQLSQKEILFLLIEYYQKGLKNLPLEANDYRKYLNDNHLDYGICCCAKNCFNTNIFYSKWVTKDESFGHYWFIPPAICEDREQIIESLQYRINNMQRILKKINE